MHVYLQIHTYKSAKNCHRQTLTHKNLFLHSCMYIFIQMRTLHSREIMYRQHTFCTTPGQHTAETQRLCATTAQQFSVKNTFYEEFDFFQSVSSYIIGKGSERESLKYSMQMECGADKISRLSVMKRRCTSEFDEMIFCLSIKTILSNPTFQTLTPKTVNRKS